MAKMTWSRNETWTFLVAAHERGSKEKKKKEKEGKRRRERKRRRREIKNEEEW